MSTGTSGPRRARGPARRGRRRRKHQVEDVEVVVAADREVDPSATVAARSTEWPSADSPLTTKDAMRSSSSTSRILTPVPPRIIVVSAPCRRPRERRRTTAGYVRSAEPSVRDCRPQCSEDPVPEEPCPSSSTRIGVWMTSRSPLDPLCAVSLSGGPEHPRRCRRRRRSRGRVLSVEGVFAAPVAATGVGGSDAGGRPSSSRPTMLSASMGRLARRRSCARWKSGVLVGRSGSARARVGDRPCERDDEGDDPDDRPSGESQADVGLGGVIFAFGSACGIARLRLPRPQARQPRRRTAGSPRIRPDTVPRG